MLRLQSFCFILSWVLTQQWLVASCIKILQDGSWYDAWAKLALMVTSGQTAVVIFFILSGAVLFDSLQKDRDSGLVPLAVKFFVRRFLRIYPAMVICLFVIWAIFNLVGLPRM